VEPDRREYGGEGDREGRVGGERGGRRGRGDMPCMNREKYIYNYTHTHNQRLIFAEIVRELTLIRIQRYLYILYTL
jgi:hypothetical protein